MYSSAERQDGFRYSTIYRAIHAGQLEVSKKCLRRKGRKASPHDEETQGHLHGHKTIHDRPRAANTCSQFGHWEGDTVQGACGKGALAIFTVKERWIAVLASWLPAFCQTGRRKSSLRHNARSSPPSLRRSSVPPPLTMEMNSLTIRPWSRGLPPKRSLPIPDVPASVLSTETPTVCSVSVSLKSLTSPLSLQDLHLVVDALNNRPRKRLGFRSPAERFPLHRLLHSD